ncbi:MAG: hypothetical protein P8184_08040 [Calditrichia bacterium]
MDVRVNQGVLQNPRSAPQGNGNAFTACDFQVQGFDIRNFLLKLMKEVLMQL